MRQETFPKDCIAEYAAARAKYQPFHSAHEGYAVLAEEVDELWDWVRHRSTDRSAAAAWQECVQIAAMAMAFATEVGVSDGETPCPQHPTPYAVRCSGDTLEGIVSISKWSPCGIVYLSREGQHGYLWQMSEPDSRWYCPNCGSSAAFQDGIYDEAMEEKTTP